MGIKFKFKVDKLPNSGIFVYHNIGFQVTDGITIKVYKFFFQMLQIKLYRKKVVYLDDYTQDKNEVVITFDDGYKNIEKYAIPILKFFNFPFELFICEDFVKSAESGDEKYLNLTSLKNIIKNGGRLQYHTKSHKNLKDIENLKILEDEIKPPKWLMEIDADGFKHLAYPYWKYNNKVIEIAKKYYISACSGNGYADNTNYSMNRFKIV